MRLVCNLLGQCDHLSCIGGRCVLVSSPAGVPTGQEMLEIKLCRHLLIVPNIIVIYFPGMPSGPVALLVLTFFSNLKTPALDTWMFFISGSFSCGGSCVFMLGDGSENTDENWLFRRLALLRGSLAMLLWSILRSEMPFSLLLYFEYMTNVFCL